MFTAEDIISPDSFLSLDTGNDDIAYIKTDALKYNNNVKWRGQVHYPRVAKIWVTGHSDYEISYDIFNKYNEFCSHWFATNKNVLNPKIHSIPLGICADCDDSSVHPILGNKEQMIEVMKLPKRSKTLAYMNFRVENYPAERQQVYELFKDTPWTKTDECVHTTDMRRNYLQEIRDSKFVFCPRGNGIDTHRMWEALYLGSIPIVKKYVAFHEFTDLPILFIDDWSDINETFLNQEYERITNINTWNMDKLKFGYWANLINNIDT
jgi:hypothetical protein